MDWRLKLKTAAKVKDARSYQYGSSYRMTPAKDAIAPKPAGSSRATSKDKFNDKM